MAPAFAEKAPVQEASMEESNVFKSTVGGSPAQTDLANQISAYRKMIEKEQEEITQLKQQVQKKTVSQSSASSGTASGTPAGGQVNWEDNSASSGGKFKFIHLIIVSIVFLLLGSYLAKVPLSAASVHPESNDEQL